MDVTINKTRLEMMTARIVNRAWEIRRAAAKQWKCPLMDLPWKICLEMAHDTTPTGWLMTAFKAADKKTEEESSPRGIYKKLRETYPERNMMDPEYMSQNDSRFAMQVMLEVFRTRKVEYVNKYDSRYRIIELTEESKKKIAA